MKKKLLCVGLVIGMLCTSCGPFRSDVSSGDAVVISEALQDEKNLDKKADVVTSEPNKADATPEAVSGQGEETTPAPTANQGNEATATPGQAAPSATYVPIISQDKVKLYDSTGTAVIGDTGYEIYNYVPSVAEVYAKMINRAGKQFEKSCQVYDLVVPTSVGITLPDNKVDKVGSSDQKESIDKLYKKIKSPVKKIKLYDPLMQHRTEYIYYRTDHHWTALGAYYAYRQFCNDTGRTPNELSQYRKASFGSFIGTFYSDSNQNKNLRKDKVKVYYPQGRHITMKVRTDSGKMVNSDVIEDASGYGISAKYCTFLGGDNAYSIVTNKDIKDDSACIVVKESFGNALVPYLADHYHKIYVVDYRYWTGKLSALAKEKKVQDILFVNNISMTRNSYLVGKLSQIIH
ncbi:MAG: DHHW family protein [Eubacteriales bacterium]|nr:DHHW family protein [Eubacteriales bacterium]